MSNTNTPLETTELLRKRFQLNFEEDSKYNGFVARANYLSHYQIEGLILFCKEYHGALSIEMGENYFLIVLR